jgi:hypothetical protein
MAQSRILGGNIGLAVATVIQNSNLNPGLQDVISQSQIADLKQSLNAIRNFAPSEASAVAGVFQDAFIAQMEVYVVLAGVCLLLCPFIFDHKPPSFAVVAAEKRYEDPAWR